MADIQVLRSINLKDAATQQIVTKLVQDVVQYSEVREAYDAARVLADRIKGDKDMEATYAVPLALLKAAALPLLSDEGAVTVFGDFLPDILANPGIDIVQGLRMKVVGMPSEDRRRFFANIMQQIAASQVRFSEKLVVMQDGTARPPTMATWVQVIRSLLARGGMDALLQDAAVTALHDADQQKVRRLAHIVETVQRAAQGEDIAEEVVVRDADGTMRLYSGGDMMPLEGAPAVPKEQAAPHAKATMPEAPQEPAPAIQPQPEPEKPADVEPQPVVAPAPPKAEQPDPVTAPVPPPAAQPRPSGMPGNALQTQYSLEDEEEIQKQTARLRDLESEPSADAVLSSRVQKLIDDQHLTFADENVRRRFEMMMKTYIKGIRNRVETEEVLQRPEKIGGIGYDTEKAQRIMEAARALIAQRSDHDGVKRLVAEAKHQETPGGTPNVPKIPEAPPEAVPAPPSVAAAAPVPPEPAPVRVQPQTSAAPPAVQRAAPSPHMEFQRAAAASGPPLLRRLQDRGKKPSMADIRAPKKLAGPTEEIRTLSVADFRKLGGTPKERIQKLYGRFVALGKESFAMRMDGIKAWRESPVYQLYLALGAESMNNGQSIADVIAARTARGAEALTEEEFHYIADLNRQLQFA